MSAFPVQPHFLVWCQLKDSKWSKTRCLSFTQGLTSRGRASSCRQKLKLVSGTTLHEYLLCPVPLTYHLALLFPFGETKRGIIQSNTHDLRQRPGIAFPEWADANTSKHGWECAHRHTAEFMMRLNKKEITLNKRMQMIIALAHYGFLCSTINYYKNRSHDVFRSTSFRMEVNKHFKWL